MELTLSIDPKSVISKLINEFRDSKDIMKVVELELLDRINRALKNRESVDGKPWLAPSQLTQDLEKVPRKDKTSRTKLEGSFKAKRTTKGLTISSNAPHARSTHFGNPLQQAFGRGRAPLPARPYLPLDSSGKFLNADVAMDLQKKIISHILRKIGSKK